MDVREENMTPKEMLEKIAEQDHSLSQQRELTVKMRHWLDVADDDMAMLRSDNAVLRKQVKTQEKIISEAQQVEVEPCSGLLADDLAEKRCSEKKIQELEKESTMMKEQNKKLTEELKSLQQDRDRDKISLSKFSVALQTLECGMEEAQLGLQSRDEVIHQKNLQLKHLEETVEDFSNIIECLRLTSQELREQLEDRQDEDSFAIVKDMMGDKEGSLSPCLSFAEEMKLLGCSAEVKTVAPSAEVKTVASSAEVKTDSTDLRHEESEELPKPPSVTVDFQTKRSAGILERARQLLMFVIILTVLVCVVSRSCTGNFSSIKTLWSGARLMLQPYCHVHYWGLPAV
ncbi:uncharacterized protein LOC119494842 isoform X2 [Sebastes umbrosus]|nr:uncharacterized protein LOC119494842 isoform X2 [Sebastes umbrosus]XP_037636945.1 uncharacterized protein LOC119494842 isoform X2 [Sebastes umbrosus]